MASAPAIVKLAETVMVEVEQAVRGFSRYHKYSIGADLRAHARAAARSAQRAWRDIEGREQRLEALAEAIDDDFVLLHEDRETLLHWAGRIERFLEDRLQLRLKDERVLGPVASGIDFLGYVIHPTHRLVRRRVVHHARQKLERWASAHVGRRWIRATPEQYRALRSTWTSYVGHFSHAATGRLQTRLHREFPWLRTALIRRRFDLQHEGRLVAVRRAQ